MLEGDGCRGRSPANKDGGSIRRSATKTRGTGGGATVCSGELHNETQKQKSTQEDVNGIRRYESTSREDSMKMEKLRESPFYGKMWSRREQGIEESKAVKREGK